MTKIQENERQDEQNREINTGARTETRRDDNQMTDED